MNEKLNSYINIIFNSISSFIKYVLNSINVFAKTKVINYRLLHFTNILILTLPSVINLEFLIIPITTCVFKEILGKYFTRIGFNKGDLIVGLCGMIPVLILIIVMKCII